MPRRKRLSITFKGDEKDQNPQIHSEELQEEYDLATLWFMV
jgi:hypothetical protein